MKRPLAAGWLPAFLILLAPGVFPAEGDHPDAGIWKKAVALAARNANWVPSDLYLRVEELNRSGLVKNIRETWMKLSLDDSERLKPEVVRALKNGEDVTDEAREKQRRKTGDAGEEDDSSIQVTTPFDPDVREAVTFAATGERRVISRSRCVGFEFTQEVEPSKGKPFRLRGKAWLEEGTGAPLLMTFTLDPKPLGVKQIENTVRFEFQGNERWYPQSVETEGTAGFLFIKKTFRTRMEFSGYERKEPGRMRDGETETNPKK
jgi:hypothetical protein